MIYGVCFEVHEIVGISSLFTPVSRWVTIPKIVSDQIFWGPLWNAVYICFLGVLKRDTAKTIWTAITSTAVPLVVAGLRLWPLAHVITYGV